MVLLRLGLRHQQYPEDALPAESPLSWKPGSCCLQKHQNLFLIYGLFQAVSAAWGDGYERGGIRDLLPKDLREGVKRRQGCLWLLLTCFGKSFFPKTPGEEPLSFFKIRAGRRHSTQDTEEFTRERENKHTPKNSVKKTNWGFSSCQSFPLDCKCFL